MEKRKKIDWEKGEKLYRLGNLSAAEIGRQIGCPSSTVPRHMKYFRVVQDKSEEVKVRTRAALATKKATNVALPTEDDIEQAVNENVALVLSHRKDVQNLAKVEQKFLKELGGDEEPTKLYITQYQGEVIKETVCLTVSSYQMDQPH